MMQYKFGSRRLVRVLSLVAAVCGLGGGVSNALAQPINKANTANLNVPNVGAVLSRTGVVAGNRTNSGDMYASTTVNTTDNGPYALQAKLTVPFTDKNNASAVNTVQALSPPGTAYVNLSTTSWVTVAIGNGGINVVNNVQLLVVWGKSNSKDPKQIPDIKLTYQVIGR